MRSKKKICLLDEIHTILSLNSLYNTKLQKSRKLKFMDKIEGTDKFKHFGNYFHDDGMHHDGGENDNISNFYARTNNTKLGVSVSINNISLRGGYSIFESPYKDGLNDGKRKYLTTGIGLKYDNWIFDISLIQCASQEDYIVYRDNSLSNPDQIASINNQNNVIIATCSFTF